MALAMWMACSMVASAHAQGSAFKDEEIDQMLAPIALYPDALLSQILMASTYPTDVAAAAKWSKAHPDLKGDAAVKQVENQVWEASVKSLVAFPQVLAMMSQKPGDVQRLGDAFLADPGRVMDRVQVLRRQAQQAGNLKSNPQQQVTTQTEANKQVIVIVPAQPQTVYVPVYQPTVVYGTWGSPSYPPYYWAPPPQYYPPSSGSFVAGVFWGAAVVGATNSLWGGFNWGGNDVNINVNRYNNVNVNNQITNTTNNTFVHNPERRGDVPYSDSKSREQYSKKQLEGADQREAFRGKEAATDGQRAARDADRAKAAETLKTSNSASKGALSGVAASGASRADADRGRTSRESTAKTSASHSASAPRPVSRTGSERAARPAPAATASPGPRSGGGDGNKP